MEKTTKEKMSATVLKTAFALIILFAARSETSADERLKGIACRSVHLWYAAPKGVEFTNAVTVEKSAPGTYFMVCGWNKGYFGMQELADGKKLLLFSVWDSGQNNPNAVEKEKRVQLLHRDPKVRVGRFGGEGTGGQSFLDYDWKIGETYRFKVTSKINGNRTEYAGYFQPPEAKQWRHLVTFSTIAGGINLGGYYSFVEDFRRNRVSTTHLRQANFGHGTVTDTGGRIHRLMRARFTADSNPVLNINAGVRAERFYLATGGEISNIDVPLGQWMTLPIPRE